MVLRNKQTSKMNYYYDLPIDIQNKIEDKVLEEYQEAHSKKMEGVFYNITEGRLSLLGKIKKSFLLWGDGGNDDEVHKEEYEWLACDILDMKMEQELEDLEMEDEDKGAEVFLERMEEALGIKYKDYYNREDADEWIIFIKEMIKEEEYE